MPGQPDSNEPTDETIGEAADQTEKSPDASAVYKYLVYGLSLPERAIRGTSGMVGGAVKESANFLVPSAFRNSRSYKAFFGQMLEFMVNDVAGVEKTPEEMESTDGIEGFVARKSVGSFIDLAGKATLHLSPLTVMAVVSDVAHGSNHYLKELASELKREGVISEDSRINNTADLLDAVGVASGKTSDALVRPPLSVDGFVETITQIRDSVAKIGADKVMSEKEIEETWTKISEEAEEQSVSLFQLSSTMTLATLQSLSAISTGALSTVRVTGNMFDRHILKHYRESLADIHSKRVYEVLSNSSQPYIDAVWSNFAAERPTITEDLLSGKLASQAWSGMRDMFGSNNDESDEKKSDETTDGR